MHSPVKIYYTVHTIVIPIFCVLQNSVAFDTSSVMTPHLSSTVVGDCTANRNLTISLTSFSLPIPNTVFYREGQTFYYGGMGLLHQIGLILQFMLILQLLVLTMTPLHVWLE